MMNKVEEQYTNWVYPLPIEDMKAAIANSQYGEIGDPLLYWPLMWPQKRGVDKLDILSAGCGTNQAAYYACRNPNWNVVGIDLSESSLAHQQMLKEKHNLTNLTLKKIDLTKVKSLGLDFDFITCTGVLHHLPNPDEGLAALKSVLRPDGVMNLMVYGTSLRLGVYMMQEVFRTLDFKQTKEDVDLARITISTLHDEHVLKRYSKIATDLAYDAGIVDTFLHPQDRSYTVRELFQFTRDAGLAFLNWTDPIEYSLEYSVPKTHPLWERISLTDLTLENRYYINDLITQLRGTHRWFCAHPDYVRRNKITFEDDSFLSCSVNLHRNTKVLLAADLTKKTAAKLEREKYQFKISSLLTQIIQKMDGKVNLKQAISNLNIDVQAQSVIIDNLKSEIKSLYELGHIYVLLPEVRPE